MKKTVLLALLAGVSLAACEDKVTKPEGPSEDAVRIAQSALIVDTHIDVPYRLQEKWDDISAATEGGDFDYPRAKEGGLDAPFMSIYTPSKLDGTPDATVLANDLISMVEKIAAEHPDKFRVAKSAADVEAAQKDGVIALPLGMENGSPIADLDLLDHFYNRGIRYVTLAHAKANAIADSSYDPERPNGGLSEYGAEVVKKMNALGIMVDISHVSDEAFWDVMALTDVPPIASHSSARHFTPGFERNMADDMIVALAKKGGVIMINAGSSFLTEAANNWGKERDAAYEAHLAASGEEKSHAGEDAFGISYRMTHPYPYATLDDVLDHIDYVVKIAGIDAVGIGSDFDGVGDSLPIGFKDVSDYPALVDGLLSRGYDEAAITKILGGNLMRVWRVVEAAAQP